jgi:hypothetical protein
MEIQFITLHEYNSKEEESFIHFLQYTDNEENINNLAEVILDADNYELAGDFVRFEIDIRNIISEKTVDEMIKCRFGSYYYMFSKCIGKMKHPFDNKDEVNNLSDYDKAILLNEMFFSLKIKELFET